MVVRNVHSASRVFRPLLLLECLEFAHDLVQTDTPLPLCRGVFFKHTEEVFVFDSYPDLLVDVGPADLLLGKVELPFATGHLPIQDLVHSFSDINAVSVLCVLVIQLHLFDRMAQLRALVRRNQLVAEVSHLYDIAVLGGRVQANLLLAVFDHLLGRLKVGWVIVVLALDRVDTASV